MGAQYVKDRLDLLLEVDVDGGSWHDAEVRQHPVVTKVSAGPREDQHLLVVLVVVFWNIQHLVDLAPQLQHGHAGLDLQGQALGAKQSEDKHGGHSIFRRLDHTRPYVVF